MLLNNIKTFNGNDQDINEWIEEFEQITDAAGLKINSLDELQNLAEEAQYDYQPGFRPVAFASRLLRGAEKNYGILRHECLLIIFGIETPTKS